MSLLRNALTATLIAAGSLAAQEKTIAERLGYPRETKLLILHADDLGVAHSEDSASFAAMNSGAVNSASVMMPTPWVTEVADYMKTHPDADIGLHLTLTSEWFTYRWSSVSSKDSVATLLDSTGMLPHDDAHVATRADTAQVERELRAQIEHALRLGIHPTHLDSHMGALFATPALMAVYVKVAREYHLPFLALRGDRRAPPAAPLTVNDVLLNNVVIADETVARDHWKDFYLDAISHLRPGLTEMIVHLGYDDSELRAVTMHHPPYGAAWRQRDYDAVTSAAFRQALKDNNVVLVTWRQLGKLVQ
jgi:chitin disaccharide deacetylase